MNDLNPKRVLEESLPAQAPAADFRADPDVSVHIDRDKFVREDHQGDITPRHAAAEEMEAKSPGSTESVLQALDISNAHEFVKTAREQALEAENQKNKNYTQTLVAGELFERVEVALRAIDSDIGSGPQAAFLQQLRRSIGEIMEGVGPTLRGGSQLSPAEAERIIQAAGLIRKLLNQIFAQLSGSSVLTPNQRNVLSSLSDLLRQLGEPEAYLKRKARQQRSKKKEEDEPIAIRLLKGLFTALKSLLTGPVESASEDDKIPATVSAGLNLEEITSPDEPEESREEKTPEESEAIFVHVLAGRVRSRKKKEGVEGVSIFGGSLGNCITDKMGEFRFSNVPHGFSYIIGPYKEGCKFDPPVVSGLVLDSMTFEFIAIEE